MRLTIAKPTADAVKNSLSVKTKAIFKAVHSFYGLISTAEVVIDNVVLAACCFFAKKIVSLSFACFFVSIFKQCSCLRTGRAGADGSTMFFWIQNS